MPTRTHKAARTRTQPSVTAVRTLEKLKFGAFHFLVQQHRVHYQACVEIHGRPYLMLYVSAPSRRLQHPCRLDRRSPDREGRVITDAIDPREPFGAENVDELLQVCAEAGLTLDEFRAHWNLTQPEAD
jgi:hypothetical protein